MDSHFFDVLVSTGAFEDDELEWARELSQTVVVNTSLKSIPDVERYYGNRCNYCHYIMEIEVTVSLFWRKVYLNTFQVVVLHHILSKATVSARPSVLWCYKKDLGFSSHRKKRMKEIKHQLSVSKINIRVSCKFLRTFSNFFIGFTLKLIEQS